MRHLLRILGLFFGFVGVATSDARTWYVKPDGTGNAPSIQAAIDSAAVGDSVLVASGTYSENLVLAKSLTLTSVDGPERTIVDGGHRARVLTIPPGDGDGPVVAQITLRNGQSSDHGGGVWIGHSRTTLRGNIIEDNVAGSSDVGEGGGVSCRSAEGTISCLIELNLIRNNYAGSSGGGIAVFSSGTQVRQNTLTGNASHVDGGGAVLGGCRFAENVIEDNYSTYFAAGAVVNAFAEFVNNTVINNRIGNTDAVPAGLDVWPFAVVRNNIIVDNRGGPLGSSQAVGVQCRHPEDSITLDCNDVWDNDIDEIRCVTGLADNFSTDPLFCNEISGDFHISDTSPCAPSGAGCGLVGALPPMCHVLSVRRVPWTRVKSLYR